MNRRLDIENVDAALKRAAYKAVHGTREERSGCYHHVQSTLMTSIRYDNKTRALDVTFMSGETYRYSNVPRDIYVALLDAESKGEFFNNHVKGVFHFAKVDSRKR
jgi:lysyl-tRNA synthetase class 2